MICKLLIPLIMMWTNTVHSQIYNYRKISSTGITNVIIGVHENVDTVMVTVKENGIISTSLFNRSDYRQISFAETGGKRNIEAKWDYESNQVTINGKSYSFKDCVHIYMNSGELFYVFQRKVRDIMRNKNYFTLISKPGNQRFVVELEYINLDTLTTNGDQIPCNKLSMRITGIPGLFWRHQYFYWYSVSDGHLVRYEGPDAAKKLETIELIGVNYN